MAVTGTTPGGQINHVELWNGSAWSETTNVSENSYQVSGDGTTSSSIKFGGSQSNADINKTEEWVGAGAAIGAYATGGNLNTGRYGHAAAVQATAHATGLAFGGTRNNPASNLTQTESYDGTSWTELADLNTARFYLSGTGTSTSALAIGGDDGSSKSVKTEGWNGSAWTELAGNLNLEREGGAGIGVYTSSLFVGGQHPPGKQTKNESWNGSSWTELADINTARAGLAGAGANNTSAIIFGGNEPPVSAKTETWNGSSWTEVIDLNDSREWLAGSGSSTSALAMGGLSPGRTANTEEWDNSTWTEVANLSNARGYLAGSGTGASATLAIAGNLGPGGASDGVTTEEWSGSTITTKVLTD